MSNGSGWWLLAACRGLETAVFFPEQGGPVASVRAVCTRCQVRTECLGYALQAGPVLGGVWGGTTPRVRQQLRRERRLEASQATA